MTQCEHCRAKTHNAYLCQNCQHQLHEMLTGLPKWLTYLHDEAIGDTCKGESVRRSTDHGSPMPCNLAASELYDNTTDMLTRWCETISLHTETLNHPGNDE